MGFLRACKDFALYFNAFLWSSGNYEPQHSLVPGFPQFVPNDANPHYAHSPEFDAPNGPENGDFECRYPSLGKEWTSCTTADDRSCWLKGPNGTKYDIHTNYETHWPPGVVREYILDVSNKTIKGDGIPNIEGKVFNNSYPGPWIRACWGDTIKVTVRNHLQYNGTSVHWHGLRQLNSSEMDGVNGVTQCPIAPTKNMTYIFNATQYGTSWAHSHYSLQYADGLVAPITIFGPSSSPYDLALDPILITDWNHRSAFEDWYRELDPQPDIPRMNSMMINGHGNFAGMFPEKKFETTVEKGKKYLMRIINTSVDTTWIFSIDNHNFTVMSSDFVPITPYVTDHVTVGIGQRYHIVLDANPIDKKKSLSPTGDYWIRATAANKCSGFEIGNEPDERQGILRYNSSSTAVPTTFRERFSLDCRDEPYDLLKPIFNWTVPKIDVLELASRYYIGKVNRTGRPEHVDTYSWWEFGQNPLWLNFSNPSILNITGTLHDDNYVVVEQTVEADSWIYMVITAPRGGGSGFFPVAHPMHLHGHDFAILAQGNDTDKIHEAKLLFNNPPRRDVALVNIGGFIIIAFKADNPGNWLFHCHIPWHASSGLALQILERQHDLQKLMTEEKLRETRRVCREWNDWFADKDNLWAHGKVPFQDDSGI